MNIIAIETATSACSVGLRTSDGIEASRVSTQSLRHAEVVTVMMSSLLDECGLEARSIDRVVVDRGPGLFTGLRVGVASAVAFAQALGCEIVTVTSLELFAQCAHDARVRGTLVSCVDARRGEIFVQTFQLGEGVVALTAATVTSAAALAAAWATSGAPVTFTGDGVVRYEQDFHAVANGQRWDQSVPSVSAAIALGARREPEYEVRPLYLRDADAVANFSTRDQRR